MEMTENEICRDYHWAVDKVNQIVILADINCVSKEEIKEILERGGEILPNKTRTRLTSTFGNRTLSPARKKQLREYSLAYREKHLEECREKSRNYYQNVLKDNPEYKARKAKYDHERRERKKAENADTIQCGSTAANQTELER